MNSKLTVAVLLTPDKKSYTVATMVLDTLRIGFPTAYLEIHLNRAKGADTEMAKDIDTRVSALAGARSVQHHCNVTLFDWIEQRLAVHSKSNSPLVLLDGDIVFWKSCESFSLEHLLSGFYVPSINNEWSGCVSVPRLHTSFLLISDPSLLYRKSQGEFKSTTYLPRNLFAPFVHYVEGTPIFYDTCANLYQAIGGASFTDEQLQCYDHVNSACFYDEMYALLKNKEAFARIHELARTNPKALRGLYKEIQTYYNEHRV